MRNDARSIEFTVIDLAEESEGLRVPPREAARTDLPETFAYSFQSREQAFVEEARQREHKEGQPVPLAPFMSYWPTYEQMMESQKNWYFYWRSEVRRERFRHTDLSYIFLYVYELINGIGWTEPETGYRLLDAIWAHYGENYPQLDGYLKEWTADFILIHNLDIPLTHIVLRSKRPLSVELMDMELQRLFREGTYRLPFDLLLSLSDYDVSRSKFYQEQGRMELEQFIPQTVAVAAHYLRKTDHPRWVQLFAPEIEATTTERYLFHRAVYDVHLYGRTTTVSAVPMHRHAPLRNWVTQMIRFTENQIRELRGFRGRLRDIRLEPNIERLIGMYLDREFTPKKDSMPAITIDSEKLDHLQRDTEYVQSMLTIEESPGASDERTENKLEMQPRIPALDKETFPSGAELQPGSPEQQSTDAKLKPATGSAGDNPASISWDTAHLDEEWSLFAGLLSASQLEALWALKSPSPTAELMRVAAQYGTMPSLIVDDINNTAMETIGDLIIDGDQIASEYMYCFEYLKG